MKQYAFDVVVALSIAAFVRAGGTQAVERDVAFGPDAAERLDLWIPTANHFPTVIFIHGGSLTTGDKSDGDYGNVCRPFAAAGLGCASVNYRLAPAHPWPAQAVDVAASVAWVRGHIAQRGGDPGKLFVIGHSSGAMLAAAIGSDDRYLARDGLSPRDLAGVVSIGSIMWDKELEQAIAAHGRSQVEEAFRKDPDLHTYGSLDAYLDHWPSRHVHKGMPPFLFLIAAAEQEHPPVLETNRKFVDDARALGNWAEFRVIPDRTHYSLIRKLAEPNDRAFAVIRDFIRRFAS